jgi:hypothetical protein
MSKSLAGGCLCGAVRYEARGEPIAVALCHCGSCRRAAGAPVVAWAMFGLESFDYTAGKAAVYASSPGVGRSFCASCGTSLAFTAGYMPGLVDVTVASLDDPEALAPQMHIWESQRLPWIHLGDGLPRHPEDPQP